MSVLFSKDWSDLSYTARAVSVVVFFKEEA